MGLGGHLTWTAVARELVHKSQVNGLKILPVEASGNNIINIIQSEVFSNNPYFTTDTTYEPKFVLPMNLPETNYCLSDTPERAYHRYDKHIIEQICEYYGVNTPQLKCELYFTEEEEKKTLNILKQNEVSSNFVVLEPQTKDSYTINKSYPFYKWQNIVDKLVEKNICVVQVGQKTSAKNLKGVINLTGKTNFREASVIVSKSKLLIAAEGGLMHAANAVGTKSIIVYTGFIHPKMTAYENNLNLWIGESHGPCGMKSLCQKCEKEAADHNENEIIDLALGELCE